jgi:hypothetical protein
MTSPLSLPVPGVGLDARRRALLARIDTVAAAWEVFEHDRSGDEPGLIATDLRRLREAARRDTVTAGLFGLIKRGKSTLLNAIVGDAVSPACATPETAVPVQVRHGEQELIEAWHVDGHVRPLDRASLRDHTSQQGRARDAGVTHVRWQLPAPVLAGGLQLVDTPGLDDADADDFFVARTKQELAAVDLGIVTFLSPPTVGAVEMDFLREILACGPERILVVANLFPQHFDDPTARDAVVEYVRGRIADVVGDRPLNFVTVCAEAAWVARRDGDPGGFERAGGAALLSAIDEIVQHTVGLPAIRSLEGELDTIVRRARAEVDLRLGLLRSEEAMDEREREVRSHLVSFEEDLDRPLDTAVRELRGLSAQARSLLQQHQLSTKRELSEARSVEEIEEVLSDAVRRVEVRSEDVFRAAQVRITRTLMELDAALDQRAHQTLLDLGASHRVVVEAQDAVGRRRVASLGTAAVGGLVGAGAGLVLVGAALGPIGLVGGALLAWRLKEARSSRRELTELRIEVSDRLASVVEEITRELDLRIDAMVREARSMALERRQAFTADLRATLDTFADLRDDPCYRAEALVRAMHTEDVLAGVAGAVRSALDDPADLEAVQP